EKCSHSRECDDLLVDNHRTALSLIDRCPRIFAPDYSRLRYVAFLTLLIAEQLPGREVQIIDEDPLGMWPPRPICCPKSITTKVPFSNRSRIERDLFWLLARLPWPWSLPLPGRPGHNRLNPNYIWSSFSGARFMCTSTETSSRSFSALICRAETDRRDSRRTRDWRRRCSLTIPPPSRPSSRLRLGARRLGAGA